MTNRKSAKFSNIFFKNNFFDKDHKNFELLGLMQKACFIHQDASGFFSNLTLGVNLQNHIENIVREEMETCDFSEINMSIVQDLDLWKETNRVESYGSELFRFKDRKGHEFCLGATAEELITKIVKNHYNGSKINLKVFQINQKYRDELRARAGLVRAKQFTMKDAYSFHCSEEEMKATYMVVKNAYLRIFKRLGLDVIVQASDAGEIGGAFSEEFLVKSAYGEGEGSLMEVGHIFQLGTTYSEKMDLRDNVRGFVQMACYGIGISRLMMAVMENHRDDLGFFGDEVFSTYDVAICAIDYHKNDNVRELADKLFAYYKSSGISAILDDRADNAGKKMVDSELIAVKHRVVISRLAFESGDFEVLERKSNKKFFVSKEELFSEFKAID